MVKMTISALCVSCVFEARAGQPPSVRAWGKHFREQILEPVIKNKVDHSNPILGPDDGVPTVVTLYHDHQPGESSAHHTHPWEHQAYITRGEGIIWVDGTEYPIKAGDCVMVPPGSLHHFKNTSDAVLSRVTFNPLSSTEG